MKLNRYLPELNKYACITRKSKFQGENDKIYIKLKFSLNAPKQNILKQIIDGTVLLEIFDPTIGEVKFSKVKLSKLDSSRYKLDKMYKHGN